MYIYIYIYIYVCVCVYIYMIIKIIISRLKLTKMFMTVKTLIRFGLELTKLII